MAFIHSNFEEPLLQAAIELDLSYAGAPVERAVRLQVFSRKPHCAVVDRVNAQAAVISPAVEIPLLRAAASED